MSLMEPIAADSAETGSAHAPTDLSRLSAPEFCRAFFAELEAREIDYAVLHGHDALPKTTGSDIDFAVKPDDLSRIEQLLSVLAREHDWALVQHWRHQVYARYFVVLDPRDPAQHLALDACAHFTKRDRLMLRSETLLQGRRRNAQGFFVPAPEAEFVYLVAKRLCKGADLGRDLPRLRELYAENAEGAERESAALVGDGVSARAALEGGVEDWRKLAVSMRSRSGPSVKLGWLEVCRRIGRLLNPGGAHVALIGPDGSGKTTLIENLKRSLEPAFTGVRVFKFRPDFTARIKPQHVAEPHVREPRSTFVSWAKVLFYFADWWIGYALRIRPALRRGELVIFDRNFDDLVVDQRRYLVQNCGWLARSLRPFVPRAAAVFLLDATPERVHARKPELPIAELERQRAEFRQIAWGNPRYRLVDADAGAEAAAGVVTREILGWLSRREESRARNHLKRAFDVVFALAALMALSPVLLVLVCLVRTQLGSPVIFKQTRPGLFGRLFTIRKFRTMTDARDANGRLLPDAQRLTAFGKFLRSTSLDELPELWNVLRGDMSIVGPRPLLVEYLPLYSREQQRRHAVLPGITGWAQVNGRNAASWPQKFALDLWYIEHQSLRLDLQIIARTAWKVLRRADISQPGRATADRFRGETTENPGGGVS